MKIAKYITILAVLLTVSACEKELDFEFHSTEPLPVIEASLTQEGAKVVITHTTPMNEPVNSAPVRDASVMLHDITAGESFPLSRQADGSFARDIAGITGHDYKIEVTIGDETFISISRMLPKPEIKSAEFLWIRMPGDDMAAFQIRFTDNVATDDFYWVRLYRNGAAYQWSVISDVASVNGIVEETLTTTHRDESQEDEKSIIRDGDIISYSVTPLSHEMADYLIALGNNSNGSVNFSGGTALGYFLASPVSTGSVIFNPSEIEYAD